VVLGNIGKVGKTYTISVRVVKVESGEIARDVTGYHKGSPDELLTKIIPTVCAKLTGTYKAASKTPIYIAVGAVAAVAVAAPVVYFATREPATQPNDAGSAITVGW
jgi:hypothetical protein